MKNFIKKIISRSNILNFYLIENGYINLKFGMFIINIFFKNVLGINRKFRGMIHFTSRITQPENLIIYGDNQKTVRFSFATSGGCYFQGINGIEIGGGTIFAYGVKMISANHDMKKPKEHIKVNSIKIGKNVWLGAGVIILPGVQIGDNSIVGAGTIVTKSFPENSLIVGNPGKNISKP